MSRSAKEATRFTATRPHAYSKPSTNSSAPSISPSGQAANTTRPTETPQQKVARLRAEHAARRLGEITTWDRVVVRGRSIADKAHRITAIGLVGLTVLAGGVAAFSISDMIIHNRRQRKIFYASQQSLREQNIIEAKAAIEQGKATEDQILLLNQERAKAEAEEARKNKKGIFARASNYVFHGFKKVDTGDSSLIAAEPAAAAADPSEVAELLERDRQAAEQGTILQTVDAQRRAVEKELESQGVKGGLLDQLAEEATESVAQKSRGWMSWITRS